MTMGVETEVEKKDKILQGEKVKELRYQHMEKIIQVDIENEPGATSWKGSE